LPPAIEAYRNAVALAPQSPLGYFRLGVAYRTQKKDREALSHFEKALALSPSFTNVLGQIMEVHIVHGETDLAIARAEQQLKVAPKNPFIYNFLGKAYLVKKDETKAEEYFKASIAADKNLMVSYMDLGNLYARGKNYDRAIRQYEEALKVDPNSLSAMMLLGMVFDSQKNTDKAKEYYERALTVDPKFAPAANNLAWIYAEHGGNIDVALSLAQTAREQLPEDPGVADTLGWIYYKKNVPLKAISLLKESAQKMESQPVVHYHLGMAYLKYGDKKLTRQELETALKLSKDFDGAEEARRVLKGL
jgi:tetratricopeptide (TPR) repeat protein